MNVKRTKEEKEKLKQEVYRLISTGHTTKEIRKKLKIGDRIIAVVKSENNIPLKVNLKKLNINDERTLKNYIRKKEKQHFDKLDKRLQEVAPGETNLSYIQKYGARAFRNNITKHI